MAPVETSESDGEGQVQPGLLDYISEPIGKVLNIGLKPVGHVVGAIGDPNGQALLDLQKQVKKEVAYTDEDNGKPDPEKPGGERIGGKQQPGQNPLRL
ncbi:uncharacterized protein K489DRAFT_409929 [Dissoconium aciculare CBS 342.82]|uniref:Uncharacterized protein n=1 Tax=Dissoconium aciculare CBS 342.82 TaxID=1314786 RepID=A0A6J3M4H9_9PEZI|nr:uncharacterized protein K489DRAFT_409929 [Dissoconium aciculare CBS 342.82]KAF1822813.1 hypothetical protein K489DRAFT_409929 [Dissoconium aciculare CBS 342.82]